MQSNMKQIKFGLLQEDTESSHTGIIKYTKGQLELSFLKICLLQHMSYMAN